MTDSKSAVTDKEFEFLIYGILFGASVATLAMVIFIEWGFI